MMKSLLLTIAVCLLSGLASANDGSTPFIKVLGVNPHGNPVNSKVDIYGKEMKQFFDVLPVDFVMSDESRSIQLISGSWIGSIACQKSYRRPTTGELRNDHMCSFQIYSKTAWNSPLHPDFDGDSYEVLQGSDNLGTMDYHNLSVLGIYPQGTKPGDVYSFYGNGAKAVAIPVIENAQGTITFASNTYTVNLTCKKNYTRPNGQERKDYMCTLSYKKN